MRPLSRDLCSVREWGVPRSTHHGAAGANEPGWAVDTSHSETSLPTSMFTCLYYRLNNEKTYRMFREIRNWRFVNMELKYVIKDYICALLGAPCGSILEQGEYWELNAEKTSFLNLRQDPALWLDLELNCETQRYCLERKQKQKIHI